MQLLSINSKILQTLPTLPKLKLGQRGEEVSYLQSRLKIVGFNLKIDSIFGDATEAAVKTFQKYNNLNVDGIVGPKTWSVLSRKNLTVVKQFQKELGLVSHRIVESNASQGMLNQEILYMD